ncbi:MAG: hypothetical protein QNJ51_13890 [Calothrix sp. MO_167.B12]|nr:hypothetical protein [Calothrix sp. MO_167.B12]
MTASSIISDLQQANRCAGKCNCCRDLQRQINQLKQQIANIPKNNEQAIINKAVKQAKDTITPLLPGIVTPIAIAAVLPKLQPLQVAQKVLKAELFATRNTAKLGLNLAKDASGKVVTARNAAEFAAKQAGRASNTASRAINVANSTGGKLATISRKATQASSTASRAFNVASSNGGKIASVSRTVLTSNTKASQALFEVGNAALQAQAARATAKSALSRVVGIAGVVSGLAASVAVLKLSETRFYAVEKTTDRFNNDLTKAFGLIQKNRSGISQNAEGIKANSKEIEQASDLALGARQEAKTANQTANKSQSTANTATQTANKAAATANTATQTANNAQTTAKGAAQTANKAAATANTATQTANNAQTIAKGANSKAVEAQIAANTATARAIQAQGKADTATDRAIKAQISANTATAQAIQAQGKADTATDKAVKAQVAANTAAAQAIQAQSKADTATNTANQAKTTAKAANTRANAAQRTGNIAFLRARRAQSTAEKALAQSKSAQLTATRTRTIGGGTAVDTETKAKIDKIDRKLDDLPKLFVARAATELGKPLTATQVQSASKAGACDAMNSPGCTSGLRSQIGNQINQANNNLSNRLSNIFGAGNAAANAQQINMLNTINTKMGAQLPGGLSGTFGRLWQTLQVDRVLNLLIYVTTLHNASMVSNNIAQTLFGAFDNIAKSVGLSWKDEKGQEIGVGKVIGNYTRGFFNTLFGAQLVDSTIANWQKANAIYQSATNMLVEVQGMFDSARSISEVAANNTGKIGNALKKAGAIYENAFDWMSEKTTAASTSQSKFDRILNGLQAIDEKASAFNSVTSNVVSIQENIKQFQEQRKEFDTNLQKAISDSSKSANNAKQQSLVKTDVNPVDIKKAD